MKVGFICEATSKLDEVVAAYLRVHPTDRPTVAAFATPVVGLNGRFVYPRGLKWSDYPYAGAPRYRPIYLSTGLAFEPRRYLENGRHERFFENDFVGDGEAAVRMAFRDADRIVLIVDRGASGELLLDHVVKSLASNGVEEPNLFRLRVRDFEPVAMDDAVRRMVPYRPDVDDLSYARSRRRFDFCFDVNSQAILAEANALVGLPRIAPSKWMVQFLYAAKRRPGLTENLYLKLMGEWVGSKGEPKPADVPSWTFFGSPTSRMAILENCIEAGYLQKEGRKLQVSDAGQRFLDLLHPDSEDHDLPFRLHAWCSMPEVEAVPRIDRYIRTFFGKNKRRVDAVRKSESERVRE